MLLTTVTTEVVGFDRLKDDLGINTTFNISDLVEYREPVSIPSEPFGPTSIMSEPTSEYPPTMFLERIEKVEHILDDQTISTRKKVIDIT